MYRYITSIGGQAIIVSDLKKVKEEKDKLVADNNQFKMNNEKLEAQVQQLSVELGTVGSDANLYQEILTQIQGNVDTAQAEIQGMAAYEIPGMDSLSLIIQDLDNTLAEAIIQALDTPSGDGIMPTDGGITSFR